MRFRFIQHDSPLATAMFTFRAGSHTDPKGQEGVSHYLEHVLLDAGSRYPTEVHVSDAFARLGAMTNGGTGFGSVTYYGTVRASKLVDMIDIHCDLVADPLLRDEDVEREGNIVRSELKDSLDDPIRMFMRGCCENLLGWHPIIGHEHTVDALGQKELRTHYEKYHGTDNLMVTVCGPVSVEDEIRDRLAGLSSKQAFVMMEPTLNLDDHVMIEPRFNQAYLMVTAQGTPGEASHFRENLVASVAANCLGGSDFSLLFRRLRGELGLTYWISADMIKWGSSGVALVMSQFEPKEMDTVKHEVKEVLDKAVTDGIPDETVDFAKATMATSIAGAFETSGSRARVFQNYHLAGAQGIPESYKEYDRMLDGVTVEEVSRFVENAYGPMLDDKLSKTVTMMPS